MSDVSKTVHFGGSSTGVVSVLESPSNIRYSCRLVYIFGLHSLAQFFFCFGHYTVLLA